MKHLGKLVTAKVAARCSLILISIVLLSYQLTFKSTLKEMTADAVLGYGLNVLSDNFKICQMCSPKWLEHDYWHEFQPMYLSGQ